MPYGNFNIARKLAGNQDTIDITDADCQQAIQYGDARVESETGHSGYLNTDPVFPLIAEASEYFAASWIRDHYEDENERGDAHYSKAMDVCFSIRESSPESLFVVSSQYKTFPLNPQGTIHRSLPGSNSTERVPFDT
jgi:hypothetical protein